MKKVDCDKCGKTFNLTGSVPSLTTLRPNAWSEVTVRFEDTVTTVDLCDRCRRRLQDWISTRDDVAVTA